MGIENWGKKGMPPIHINVLDRQIIKGSDTSEIQIIFIEGSHPHLGKLHRGWYGEETIVIKKVFQKRGLNNEKIVKDEFYINNFLLSDKGRETLRHKKPI